MPLDKLFYSLIVATFFSFVAQNLGADDVRKEIQFNNLESAVLDDYRSSISENSPVIGITEQDVFFTFENGRDELISIAEQYQYQCSEMENNRIGCRKEVDCGNARLELGLTFQDSGVLITFRHGQAGRVP